MERIDRRTFLAALGAATVVVACSSDGEGADVERPGGGRPAGDAVAAASVDPRPDLTDELFALGVASGDPLSDRVVLWTRLVSDPLAAVSNIGTDEVEIAYDVATDDSFDELVASGTVTATAALAHSVHLDVTGLKADTWYCYRFRIGERMSPVGRTRTLPAADASPEQFRFVVASCQDFQWGHYAAWQHAAEEDGLDAVFFLGDYVYEYSVGDQSPSKTSARVWANESATTLEEYRLRYAQVRADVSLRKAHQQVPWIITWDDHEVSNNYAGDVGSYDVYEPRSRDRRLAGYQAWYEHMPVRISPEPTDFDDMALHRSFRFGTLASAFVIETREYADPAPCRVAMPDGTPALAFTDDRPSCDARFDGGRSNLGVAQEKWLIAEMTESDTVWNILANPTMLGGMNIGTREEPEYTLDMWDGYVAVRNRVLKAIADADVSNPVVVTGDWHASFVLDVVPEGANEALMTEFVVTSISSVVFATDYREANDHIRYFHAKNGYAVFTVTADELLAEYKYLADVWDPMSPIDQIDAFVVRSGNRVAEAQPNAAQPSRAQSATLPG